MSFDWPSTEAVASEAGLGKNEVVEAALNATASIIDTTTFY